MGNDNNGRQMAQEELDFETRLDLLAIELKAIGKMIAEMKEKAEAIQRLTEGN